MAAKRGREFWSGFLAKHAKSGQSLADYCRKHGVSYKTARNWSSKLSGDSEQGQGQPKQGQGQKGRGQKRATASASDQKKSRPLPKKGAEVPPRKKKEPHPNSLANLNPIVRGEQRALKHGGYARYFPPEVTDAADEDLNAASRLDSLIRLTEFRLRSVLMKRAEWDAKDDYGELSSEDYHLSEVTNKSGMDGDEKTTKRVRPPFDAMVDTLTGKMGWLVAEKHRIERHLDLTAGVAAAKRAEIMEQAEDESWSAADTGSEIEKLGLEVPYTLQQRIRSELALAEPEEPEGGVTDDELDQLSSEYAANVAQEGEWLEARRDEVEEMHQAKEQEKKGE